MNLTLAYSASDLTPPASALSIIHSESVRRGGAIENWVKNVLIKTVSLQHQCLILPLQKGDANKIFLRFVQNWAAGQITLNTE